MRIDLPTLYTLAIGTLFVGAAMMLWERQAHPRRARELEIWAASCGLFALGCIVAMSRTSFPGVSGWALTNVIMVAAYLLVLHGVLRLDGRGHFVGSVVTLVAVALVWTLGGTRFRDIFWNHVASLPIALVCGLTALALLRNHTIQALRSRRVVAAISGGHALFYLIRAFVVPALAARYGRDLLPVFAKLTMYEGVLYSVAMPMGFMALVREEAQSELLAASRTDHLTGLGNRYRFFEDGSRLLAASAQGEPLSLLALDLDHFKAINDRFGHAAGDEVLKLFARISADEVGSNAILARLGGEEFAALVPGRGCAAAKELGETIARRFAEAAANSEGLAIPATVSVGVAERGAVGDLAGLLSSADGALYRAKARGRNRVEIAEPIRLASAA